MWEGLSNNRYCIGYRFVFGVCFQRKLIYNQKYHKQMERKHIKSFNSQNIKEDFDPIIGISHLLNDPIMVALATSWLVQKRYKIDNLTSNLKGMKNDFLDYCNLMGYTIDKEVLDSIFEQFIQAIRKIIKI